MPVQHKSLGKSTSPVLALHSSASNGGQWQQLVADLEPRFEVFTPDLPGYRLPCAQDDCTRSTSEQLINEMDEIGEPIHVVGHSNGAAIALKIALTRPDLVKSLTVYEPAAFHILGTGDDSNRRLFREIMQLSSLVSASAATEDPQLAMEIFIDFWNGKGSWCRLPKLVQARMNGMVNPVIRDFAEGFAETWAINELGVLDVPTLVMMGLDSPMVSQRVAIEIAHAIPGARIALLPELNHMAPVFQPEWINPRILEHIASTERPQTAFSWPEKRAA